MRFRLCLLILMTMALMSAANAQNAGFRVGIAPPPAAVNTPVQPFVTAPVQPFVSAPVQAFGTAPVQQFGTATIPAQHRGFEARPRMVPPVAPTPYSPVYFFPPAGYGSAPGISNNGTTIIVPNGTVFVNSTVIYQQPPAQSFNAWPGSAQVATAPAFQPPAVGTPRAHVLHQFGAPISTITNQAGETMFFSGGRSVYIQNGRVARPN